MKPIALGLGAIALFGMGSITPATIAQPAMAGLWESYEGSLTDCRRQAMQAMRQLAFHEVEVVADDSVFAYSGNYHISLLCIPEKSTIAIYAAGPEDAKADELIHRLADEFFTL